MVVKANWGLKEFLKNDKSQFSCRSINCSLYSLPTTGMSPWGGKLQLDVQNSNNSMSCHSCSVSYSFFRQQQRWIHKALHWNCGLLFSPLNEDNHRGRKNLRLIFFSQWRKAEKLWKKRWKFIGPLRLF